MFVTLGIGDILPRLFLHSLNLLLVANSFLLSIGEPEAVLHRQPRVPGYLIDNHPRICHGWRRHLTVSTSVLIIPVKFTEGNWELQANETVITAVKRYLKISHTSQRQLAQAMGIHECYLSLLLSGRRNWSIHLINLYTTITDTELIIK